MAEILKELTFPKQRGSVPMSVVLSKADGRHPYVTHLRDDSAGGPHRGKFWGRYFETQFVAYEDFRKRCIEMAKTCQAQGLELPWLKLNEIGIRGSDV